MTPQSILVCLLLGMAMLLLAPRGFNKPERRLVLLALLLHVGAAFALVIYHEHVAVGGGDMLTYRVIGSQIARAIDADPGRWGVETLKLALQRDNDLPIEVMLPGTATGTMCAFAGLIMFFTGDALYGACMVVSFFSFWGSVCMCAAMRPLLKEGERIAAMLGILFMPSVLFWTGGLVKEAFVVGFLGIALRGLVDTLLRRRALSAIGLVVGIQGILVTKPYVLIALAVAMGAWFMGDRRRRLAFGYQVAGTFAVVLGLVVVARQFPEFSPENIIESMNRSRQSYAFAAGGGSNIEIGQDAEDLSVLSQLRWAPIGLLNAVARPFLFEIKNGAMLLAAVETTGVLTLLVVLFFKFGVRRVFAEVRNDRLLRTMFVLVLTFGTSVGLATKNLGTLSRYRVPMMPAYVASVLVLRKRLRPGVEGVSASRASSVRPHPLLVKARRGQRPGRVPRTTRAGFP